MNYTLEYYRDLAIFWCGSRHGPDAAVVRGDVVSVVWCPGDLVTSIKSSHVSI